MKEIRQRTIRKILSKRQVQNQDELLNLLAEDGIATTQATLSRDLKEMRVVKLHRPDGGYFFSLPVESMHVVPDAVSGSVRGLSDTPVMVAPSMSEVAAFACSSSDRVTTVLVLTDTPLCSLKVNV